MPTVQHNNSAARLIRQYERKERGYSAAAKELQRRFAGLDWAQQKRVMLAFLQGTPSLRRWVYTRMLDLWDDAFVEPVQLVWVQYHEERCSWVIIRHFPWEYVSEQIDALLYFDGNYRFLQKRFPEQMEVAGGQSQEKDSDNDKITWTDEISDFWRAVQICCSVVFPLDDKGIPVVEPSLVLKRRLLQSYGAPSPRDITEIDNAFYPILEKGDRALIAAISRWCEKIRDEVSHDPYFSSYSLSRADATNYSRVVYLMLVKHMKLFIEKFSGDESLPWYHPICRTTGYTEEQLDELIRHFLFGGSLSWEEQIVDESGCVTIERNHPTVEMLRSELVLPTGFEELDENLRGGLLKGTLNLLSGRPMMGTTALAYSIICNVAVDRGIPTALFTTERTLEMAKDRLRFVEFGYMQDDGTEMDEMPDAIKNLEDIGFRRQLTFREREQRLQSAPLGIEHGTFGVGMDDVESFVERQVEENHVQLVVIDRIDQLSYAGCDPHEQAMRLAALAERTGVVILACSGASGNVDYRVGNEPCIADVLGSEAFEVYANTVMLLYRPEYYGIREDDCGNTHEVMYVTLAKNNQGPSGYEIRLHFKNYARVCGWPKFDVSQFPIDND